MAYEGGYIVDRERLRKVAEMTLRDAGDMHLNHWPKERPFPLSDAECAAVCHGHAVRWDGTIDDMLALPGRYELLDGWLMLKR